MGSSIGSSYCIAAITAAASSQPVVVVVVAGAVVAAIAARAASGAGCRFGFVADAGCVGDVGCCCSCCCRSCVLRLLSLSLPVLMLLLLLLWLLDLFTAIISSGGPEVVWLSEVSRMTLRHLPSPIHTRMDGWQAAFQSCSASAPGHHCYCCC